MVFLDVLLVSREQSSQLLLVGWKLRLNGKYIQLLNPVPLKETRSLSSNSEFEIGRQKAREASRKTVPGKEHFLPKGVSFLNSIYEATIQIHKNTVRRKCFLPRN